ncbi:MAG: 6-pyruvoyl-tetrahydropterin synthase-related protein [cyanobacterium endosymbiont of Rhopalodia musculus]|uniref:6-pyruvoyl-tetrahydropterin synthase-related protein n=1 Tax=cyanobacterium endosymbiont of Epithemia clementina EcSB TaxID=3034674 RepID=UPI0024810BDE|nr:6-pyruvoyl-tetrahydropterin synthase-related protein [cyanobacterium endosymbiont of Epithemia clementina EcSB]WGT68317.1 hypothetical protein P3F56_04490 [cyanobacterium endosymbiont of Epithemia clementina EcSB]
MTLKLNLRILRFTSLSKLWITHYSKNLLVIFLYSMIAIGLMGPMASNSIIFSTGETQAHLAYLIQGRMALEEGQFPLRIAPYENNGLRYASFQFYSQIPYTLGGLIYKFITPDNPYTAYKIMLWGALFIGGLFIYRLSRWLTGNHIAAILAGLSYMSAPYFLNTIHARGAFPEAIAQGILPIVLYYTIRTFNSPKIYYILLSSIAWFTLAVTHIITFIYGSLFFGIFGVLLVLKKTKNCTLIKQLARATISYLSGWLLGMYFLMPVVLESKYVSMRFYIDQISPYFTNWMTPLANLLAPAALPPTPTGEGITYGLTPAVGWVFLAAWGVVVYYYSSLKTLPPSLSANHAYIFALLSIFPLVLFITWSPINFWHLLPRSLWVTQFTFRFLTHVMWSGALLVGYASILLFKRHLNSRHLLIGILVIVIANRSWLPIPKGNITVNEVLEDPKFGHSGAVDYLNRSPVNTLYGNAQLPLLANTWIPGHGSWDHINNRLLPVVLENEPSWRILPIWKETDSPVLVLEGQVVQDTVPNPTTLLVTVLELHSDENKEILGEISLNKPRISARIPFASEKLKNLEFNEGLFRLQLIVQGNIEQGQRPKIELDNFVFEGISSENTTIPLDITKNQCKSRGFKTICELFVGEQAQVVQLPVMYYPRMQLVKIDGRLVEYFPVNHYEYNLVGLRLKPGNHNIQVIFTGLAWANSISFVAWLSVILIAITLNTNNIKKMSNKIIKK